MSDFPKHVWLREGIRNRGIPKKEGVYAQYVMVEHAESELAKVREERDAWKRSAETADIDAKLLFAERDQLRAELSEVRADLDAREESRRKWMESCEKHMAMIDTAPVAIVKHYDFIGEWALQKEDAIGIYEPLKGHRVALVKLEGK